jgi:hypothetical protein
LGHPAASGVVRESDEAELEGIASMVSGLKLFVASSLSFHFFWRTSLNFDEILVGGDWN